jgi:hypothetical protein
MLKPIFFLMLFILTSCLSKEDAQSLTGDISSGNGSVGEANSLGFLITSIYPSSGAFTGEYQVTINGSQFNESTKFYFGTNECLETLFLSSSTVICKIPAGVAGLVDVKAEKTDKVFTQTSGFRYTGSVSVTAIDLVTGPSTVSQLVTITGSNFSSGATVTFSHPSLPLSNCTSVNVVSSSQIRCYTPLLTAAQSHSVAASGVAASIIVTNPDTTLSSLNNVYTFLPAPLMTHLSYGGANATKPPVDGVFHDGLNPYILSIHGTYFAPLLTVTINNIPAPDCAYLSATIIRCTALPAQIEGQANYIIRITNTDSQVSSFSELFVNKPNVTSFSPAIAKIDGGTILTLNGSGLGLVAPTVNVHRNDNNALIAACPLFGTSPLRCTTPNVGSALTAYFRITNDYGYVANSPSFMFVNATNLEMTPDPFIGAVVQGSTYNHVITVLNPSLSVDATDFSISYPGLSAPYSFVSTNCGATISVGTNCTVTFRYEPTGLEMHESSEITFSYNNGLEVVNHQFKLRAWGVELVFIKKDLDFGTLTVGDNHETPGKKPRATRILVVSNRGAAPVSIDNFQLSDVANFRHRGGTFPGNNWATPTGKECPSNGVIPAKTVCHLSLDFEPQSQNSFSATYKLLYNSGHETKLAQLSGVGLGVTRTNCDPGGTPYGGGAGTVLDPWRICSEAHFHNIITNTQANIHRGSEFIQLADINFTTNAANFIYFQTGFRYDGNGYKIRDFYLSQPGSNTGMLHNTTNTSATLINMQVENGYVSGNSAGGLSSRRTHIRDSYFQGEVHGTGTVGGIAGSGGAGSANNVFAIGTVTGSSLHVGGITGASHVGDDLLFFGDIESTNSYAGGIAGSGGSIDNAYAVANIKGTSGLGGIVSNTSTITLTNCHFEGTIEGTTNLGGMIGYVNNSAISISNSSSRGEIKSISQDIGGLIGIAVGASASSIINQSYSNMKLNGRRQGGLAGASTAIYVTDSFSISNLNYIDQSAGGICGNAAGGASTFNRIYVSSPFGVNHMNGPVGVNYKAISLVGAGMTFDKVYYLTGSVKEQTDTGIQGLNMSQMSDQNVFEIAGGWDFVTPIWKMPTSGYPHPILHWMADDWMP